MGLPTIQKAIRRRPETVFLALPTYDCRTDIGNVNAVHKQMSGVRIIEQFNNASLLAFNFNVLWCNALNLREQQPELGITHFCLVHADVHPIDDDWLPTLLEEMEALGLGMISAVIPIKDGRGLTSTGLDVSALPGQRPWATRRLTMTEVMGLPETFDGRQAAAGIDCWPDELDPVLLINTGLLLIDLRQPWVTDPSVFFTINDAVRRDPDTGLLEAHCEPEDWGFSRKMKKLGVRYAATRKVRLEHFGRTGYPNTIAWGTCATDPSFTYQVEAVHA